MKIKISFHILEVLGDLKLQKKKRKTNSFHSLTKRIGNKSRKKNNKNLRIKLKQKSRRICKRKESEKESSKSKYKI